MKMMIALTTLAMSSSAFASIPNCPRGSQEVLNCLSTPKKGDFEVAAEMFDAIKVCQKGDKATMIFSIRDEGQKMPATIEMRMGGTTYSAQADDAVFSLSVPVIPGDEIPATYMVKLGSGMKVTSTYTCQR